MLGKQGPFPVIEDRGSGDVVAPMEPPRRRYSCDNYETCLSLAATLNWDNFTCRGCNGLISENLLWRAHQAHRRDRIAQRICDIPALDCVNDGAKNGGARSDGARSESAKNDGAKGDQQSNAKVLSLSKRTSAPRSKEPYLGPESEESIGEIELPLAEAAVIENFAFDGSAPHEMIQRVPSTGNLAQRSAGTPIAPKRIRPSKN
ncbi:MAG: hypothetical protein KDD64_08900 [Bdellovibrionales bacterium]|nr:hypothetical protein [Bdellovibrionales bacterium]